MPSLLVFFLFPSHEQQWIQLKQVNVALSTKRGRIYRIERILQGICSILDTFVFTLDDWASYAEGFDKCEVIPDRKGTTKLKLVFC